MQNYNLMEYALKYARMGLSVFPLIPGGKQPATTHGFKEATTDEKVIRKWWAGNPDFNIGIATGAASGGLVVIDIDDGHKSGVSGSANLARWENENGRALPETVTARTPSGGRHLYYLNDTGEVFKNRANVIESVDIRSDGGYVVAPPSIRSDGVRYAWQVSPEMSPCAHINETVKHFLTPAKKRLQAKKESPQKAEKFPEGTRVSSLVSSIGDYFRRGLPEEDIVVLIRSENARRCDPPLTEEELQREVFPALSRGWEKDACIHVKTADELDDTPVEWLVPNWIPRRGVVFLCADGGVGKTFAWVSILSSLSRGESTFLCDDPTFSEEQKVLCFSGEDPENILRKRFEDAGGNLRNIFVVAQDTEGNDITFGSKKLEKAIEDIRPSIMVFDPLQSFVGKDIDMSRRNHMRAALRPLQVLSSKFNVPIVIVSHTNKRSGESGRNKMSDSSDIWDIARAVIMFGYDSESTRYASLEKSSYADHLKVPTKLFTLDDNRVTVTGTTSKKMKDFIQEEKSSRNSANLDIRPAYEECCTAIVEILNEHGGTYSGDDLDLELKQIFSDKTIKTAKGKLKERNLAKWKKRKDGKVDYYLVELTPPPEM